MVSVFKTISYDKVIFLSFSAGVRSIIEAGLGKSVADLNGKTVVLEIVAPGNGQSVSWQSGIQMRVGK